MGIKLLFGPHNCIYCINPLLEVIPATMKQRELIFKDNCLSDSILQHNVKQPAKKDYHQGY